MAKNYKLLLGLVVLLAALSVVGYFVSTNTKEDSTGKSDETSNVVDGFRSKNDLINVYSPQENETIESPLTIRGEARGSWYFEATFPIVLVDWDGLIIAESYAQAEGEWTTPEFVPFEAILEFKTPSYGDRGTLILQKSNPSGLPEHDNALEVRIKFKPRNDNNRDNKRDGCIITGCSDHVCAEEEVITTCEYLPEYECYKTAVCERQNNGQCGWTITEELRVCVEGSK